MMLINIYIVEDDISFRERAIEFINKKIKNEKPFIEIIVHEIKEINIFYKRLEHSIINDSDLFLIDIELRTYFNGIDIGKMIRKRNKKCKIIYLTNLDSKASEIINKGIKADAYLLKSDSCEIMSFKLNDILEDLSKNLIDQLQNTDKQIAFKEHDRIIIINFDDILYLNVIPGMRNALFVKCKDKELIVSGVLRKMKKRFPDPPFFLDLKSYIINLNLIEELIRAEGVVVFNDGHELFLSPEVVSKIIKKGMEKTDD